MKKLWLSFKKHIRQYLTLVRRMNEVTTLKNTLKAVFFALVTTLFIFLIPVLVIVNLFIFTHLMHLLVTLLVIIVFFWVIMYFHFYYLLLKQYHPKLLDLNLRRVQYIETIIVSFVLILVSIIVLSVIF
jgi:fatty acid desaturase